MGYIRNHAIVVSGWGDRIAAAHAAAIAIAGDQRNVSNLVDHPVNGCASFFMAPDGSKEGWSDSAQGDEARNALIERLRTDPSMQFCDWAEIVLGSDDSEYRITRNAVGTGEDE